MAQMPKVSIIIPVFNIERYLKQCLDSILTQTLSDIEIILVDDGSTDKSGAICDKYASKDERIQVIHKANEGLSCARNDGINVSKAPYIMFVDGDDWIEQDFCQLPYRTAIDNNADLVLFTYNAIKKDGKVVQKKAKIQSSIINEAEAIYLNYSGLNSAWLGLYRRSLFDKVRYPAGKLFEDVGTSHELIHVANTICFVPQALYNHRIGRMGSITSVPDNWISNDWKEMYAKKIFDLRDWGYKEYSHIYSLQMLIKYGWNDASLKPFADIVKGTLGHTTRIFNIKQRMILILFRLSPSLFDIICIALGKRVK